MVFRSEKEGSWPYLLFYITGPEAGDYVVESGNTKTMRFVPGL